MTRPTRFGVTLPQIKRSWAEASTAARAFDELGFDSVWVCDHLFGVPNPATPIFEAWSELAAVAAITQHVELGTLVTPPYFRNPAILAKQIATIDQISGGRCIAGLGAGWYEAEFKAYGCDYPPLAERMRALEDMAEILRRMWSEERASYEGPSAVIREAVCEPKPVRRPPILIGGGGERVLMGIVARHADIWNNMGVFQAQLGAKVEALERRCDQEGRDFSSLEISQQCLSSSQRTSRARRPHSRRPSGSTAVIWEEGSRSMASGEHRSG